VSIQISFLYSPTWKTHPALHESFLSSTKFRCLISFNKMDTPNILRHWQILVPNWKWGILSNFKGKAAVRFKQRMRFPLSKRVEIKKIYWSNYSVHNLNFNGLVCNLKDLTPMGRMVCVHFKPILSQTLFHIGITLIIRYT
jgi:hypothetical protein